MLYWLLLYSLFAFSQDQSVEEYCFTTPSKMKETQAKLKFILVPSDQIQSSENCFTIISSAHRRELIQGYVRRLDPQVQISFSSAEIKRDPCQIKVEKIREKIQESANTSVQPNDGIIKIGASVGQSESSGADVTKIQTIKEFELTVNQDVVKGECKSITPNRYEIKIEVNREPVPLVPQASPGTIVIVPNSQAIKEQETSRLSTTLQLNKGERIEIGSVVKRLKDDGRKIEGMDGASVKNSQGQQIERVFLSID